MSCLCEFLTRVVSLMLPLVVVESVSSPIEGRGGVEGGSESVFVFVARCVKLGL